jgi:RNase P/RNase MRP subunit p30
MERIILREKNFSKLKELVKKNKDKEVIFSSDDDVLNRKVLDKLQINILLINLEIRKDFSKQRNSGFNDVMAKIAKKKNIQIGINLDELIYSINRERVVSRLRQNVRLCNRNRIQMKFIQGKVDRDLIVLKSLGLVLGMPSWMVKNL